ncbi:rhodopsin, GQ-coupled isoform X1 [Octopus bimaculoides]|uniref:G-protein coupled receptors family 1 profile domain-containing protein n=1 Tax=Octopus bimaculoides TaxID=37653 RepID=A0A0L8HPF2_OCTBM|nr:rhodopsin, GQ-coupled isoform X1 [Octopus bimaculoides]XP_014770596.1 rhodopsin, GQ-coupled isoform X1 [Octopus bimaculoides]|eukprot:XP_014770595.1 PREDICTED: rhodopsin, GQ-coupled-like [Octopus bimaculoides]
MEALIDHLLETSSNENMTLEILNEKIFLMNQPTIVFIFLLYPIGILGNTAVIYIYLCCLRFSNLNLFISSLAFFDLICCMIGINFELIDLFLPVMHPSKVICKFQRLSVFFCCIGSSLMLLAIAVERYQKVCRPTNFQISTCQGRILTFVINFCSLAFSLPVIWAVKLDVPHFENKLNVSTCEFKSSLSWRLYFGAVFLGYSLDLIVNFVLYCLVWRTARRHFLRLDMPDESKTDKDKRKNIRKLHRINRTVISITALFALSFSPFCILSLLPKNVDSKNFKIEETIRRLLSRLWILNCTMNPVVYGFCNKEFRIQIKRILYGLVRKNISTTSSQIDCTEDDEK